MTGPLSRGEGVETGAISSLLEDSRSIRGAKDGLKKLIPLRSYEKIHRTEPNSWKKDVSRALLTGRVKSGGGGTQQKNEGGGGGGDLVV